MRVALSLLLAAVVLGGCGASPATYPPVSFSTPTWIPYPHPEDATTLPFEIEVEPYPRDESQTRAADICKANGWHLPSISEWIAVEQSALPSGFSRPPLEWIGRPANAIEPTGDVMEDLDPSAALPWRCARLISSR